MNNTFRVIGMLFLVVSNSLLFAQSKSTFQVIDEDSQQPISSAYYEYGDIKGVTPENGLIELIYLAEQNLILSHISYGTWELNDQEVANAIKLGLSSRKSLEINLYPVTVIGIKTNTSPTQGVDLQSNDWMSHDGGAVLNQSTGFTSIRKSGGYGFDPVFRGFKYDQLNVVIDGAQSATSACPNRMDPPTSQMAPNMMNRIEVLKGPFALRYGTGFGATINFIPASLKFSSKPSVYGRATSGYESNGSIFRNEGQLGISSQFIDWSVSASWSEGDDYTTANDETVQSDFKRGSFGTTLGIKPSTNQQIKLSAVYNRARNADFAALPMDLRKDDTWLFNVRHDIQINRDHLKSWNTTVYASMVDHTMDNLLKPLDPRMMNAATDATTKNYGGRSESISKFNKNTLYAGADYRLEGADGTRSREFLMGPMMGMTVYDNVWQDGQILKSGAFAEYHLHANDLHAVFSGRLEMNSASVNNESEEFSSVYSEKSKSDFNPSISIGVSKLLTNQTKVGLWTGRAQRSGSLTERYINFFPVGQDPYEVVGNPNINPEINNQIDLTFEWNASTTAIDIDVFGAYLQDFISSRIDESLTPRLSNSPGVRRVINIDEAFKTGFEVIWTQILGLGIKHRLSAAYTYAQDMSRNEPLPQIAPLDTRYILSGNYFNGKLRPTLSVRYVMQQDRVSNEYGESTTPTFTLVDLKVSYEQLRNLQVSAGINNFFDTNYYEHLNRSVVNSSDRIYAPGRNFFTSLNFSF
ncbi:MAG: TonB-dependent receptor [Flammeovirgaceae bacterium]|nr:TonB-dependent receptor [Flammeovirgaceae bacterium]|tara:strand:- start:3724 stop:5979 length:2256 start_codon:yes stop_codon:yes gene_type:complete